MTYTVSSGTLNLTQPNREDGMWDWGGGELASATAVAQTSTAYMESYTPQLIVTR